MGSWDSNCSGGNQNPRHELLRNEIDTGEQGGCHGGTRVLHQGRMEAAGQLTWGVGSDVPSTSLALCSRSDRIVQLLVFHLAGGSGQQPRLF